MQVCVCVCRFWQAEILSITLGVVKGGCCLFVAFCKERAAQHACKMSPQVLLKVAQVTPPLFAESRLAFQNNTADQPCGGEINKLRCSVCVTKIVDACPTVLSPKPISLRTKPEWPSLESPSGRPPVMSLTFSNLVWTETSDAGVSCGLGSILLRSAPLELLTTKCVPTLKPSGQKSNNQNLWVLQQTVLWRPVKLVAVQSEAPSENGLFKLLIPLCESS